MEEFVEFYHDGSAVYSSIRYLQPWTTEISTGQSAFDEIPFNDDIALRIIGGSGPKYLEPDCYIELTINCIDKRT